MDGGRAKAFSDGRITDPQHADAGDIVVAQFTVEGTNDGPLGSMRPTGRKMSLFFCDVCHFDKQGRIVSGSCYYDQYTLLAQLGHIQPLEPAACARKPRTHHQYKLQSRAILRAFFSRQKQAESAT
jgi:hypothetical protein